MNTNQRLLVYDGLKKCPRCRAIKDIENFPKNRTRKDGHGSTCKECDKKHQKKYRNIHRDEILEKKRIWYRDNIEIARERLRNPKAKTKRKEWAKNNWGKVLSYAKQIREKYPDRIAARTKVGNAIKYGKIPNPKSLKCINCGNKASEYHHHRGYDKEHWLDVVPVCNTCHNIIEHP